MFILVCQVTEKDMWSVAINARVRNGFNLSNCDWRFQMWVK